MRLLHDFANGNFKDITKRVSRWLSVEDEIHYNKIIRQAQEELGYSVIYFFFRLALLIPFKKNC